MSNYEPSKEHVGDSNELALGCVHCTVPIHSVLELTVPWPQLNLLFWHEICAQVTACRMSTLKHAPLSFLINQACQESTPWSEAPPSIKQFMDSPRTGLNSPLERLIDLFESTDSLTHSNPNQWCAQKCPGRAGETGQRIGLLPCLCLTQVGSLASIMIPWACEGTARCGAKIKTKHKKYPHT